MNENIKFKRYIATPGEKHLGIAEVYYKDILLRYKISPGKEGGWYVQPASHKINDFGEERYVPSFRIDSITAGEEVEACVRSNVKSLITIDSPIPF